MRQQWDIIIVGGGAAGLFAAITAAKANGNKRIAVLERETRVAKKLLTTGNGRCNLSNRGDLQSRYYGDEAFARQAFAQFGVAQTCGMMEQLGIPCISLEEGKLFPRSLQAASVVDMLRYAAADLGVALVTETVVQSVQVGSPYRVVTDKGEWLSRQVLIATGGRSCIGKVQGPDGYELLQKLGYSVTKLTPAIVQVTTEKEPIKPLAGIKVEGKVTVTAGKEQRTEWGEILFTEYGVSGPPVLQISSIVGRHGGGRLTLDLMPDVTREELQREILSRCRRFSKRTCEDLLTGLMNKRLGQTVLKQGGVEKLSRLCGSVTEKEAAAVAERIKAFPLTATGTKGWNHAQVTCGGVDTVDFSPHTMESKRHKGLYVAGEVLNVTGDCGGFNLQWAWTSGYLAGRAMGEATV